MPASKVFVPVRVTLTWFKVAESVFVPPPNVPAVDPSNVAQCELIQVLPVMFVNTM